MNQPPLPSETKYWSCATDRQRVVNGLFDRAAEHYDRACNIMSFGSGQSYRREALGRAGLRQGMEVLDVGTGTGLLAREIVQLIGRSGRVTGINPAFRMIAKARDRLNIPLVQSIGECLPFSDGRFDFITMGYALRHVPDLDETFGEYLRVLRPGGRVVLLEMTRPTSKLGMALARLYLGAIVPFVTRMTRRSAEAAQLMRFHWYTITQCVPPETVIASLGRSGFAAPTRTVIYGIFSEYTAVRGR